MEDTDKLHWHDSDIIIKLGMLARSDALPVTLKAPMQLSLQCE